MKYATLTVLLVLLLTGGSCKKNPPVGPPACDTCGIDTTHHPTSGDTTSHNFIWSEKSVNGEAGLNGCWVFGSNNIYVVGGSVWKWNGSIWKDVSPRSSRGNLLSGQLSGYSMFAFQENDYWLTDGGIIYHYTGSIAQRYDFGPSTISGPLHSSWGTSSKDIYSVGDGGTILHFDGTSWTKMQSGTTLDIKNIWGTSDQNIWACGFKPTTAQSVLLHYNGVSWQVIDLATLGPIGPGHHTLNGVWTCDSANHTFTTTSGSLVYRETDSNPWRNDSGSVPNTLSSSQYIGLYNIDGNSANDIMAVGDGGLIVHWNGKSWYRYESLYNPSNGDYITNALSVKDNTSVVVGGKNGGAWIAIGQR